jgi:hypothetical protein
MIEGTLHHDVITHRTLSNEQAAERYSEGALMLIATALLARYVGDSHGQVSKQRSSGAAGGVGDPPSIGPPARRSPPPGSAHGEITAGVEPAQRRGGPAASSEPTVPAASTKTKASVGPRHVECFLPGTLVHTPSGPRPIEALRPGDRVCAFDVDGSAEDVSTVLSCMESPATRIVEVVVGAAAIRCTPMHPFWVLGEGWRSAGTLAAGAALRTKEDSVRIESVSECDGEFRVFNLEVSGHHNYFVGESAVLVHNKAQRWTAQDRALDLKDRTSAVHRDVLALPESVAERPELVRRATIAQREADALDAEASVPRATGESMEASRPRIEALEQELLWLEERVDAATLPHRARGLQHRVRAMTTEAEALPKTVAEKWQLLQDLRRAEGEANAIKELADESPASTENLRREIERVEADLLDIEHVIRKTKSEPDAASRLPRPSLEYPANHLPTGGVRPYVPPRRAGNPEIVRHPEGQGFLDENGNRWEWARDQHGGPHWDVQHPNGYHTNVYPDGKVHQGEDNF